MCMDFLIQCCALVHVPKRGTTWNKSPKIASSSERGASVCIGGRMCVDIGRRAQDGVPEQFLDEFQIASLLVDNRCGGTPERVKVSRPAIASDPEWDRAHPS